METQSVAPDPGAYLVVGTRSGGSGARRRWHRRSSGSSARSSPGSPVRYWAWTGGLPGSERVRRRP